MTLMAMAMAVSRVRRHDRNIRKMAVSVSTAIGGMNFVWFSRVMRLYVSLISRLPL